MVRSAATCIQLEAVEVECTHCATPMTSHLGGGGTIRYYCCPSCHRWTSSVYAEVFRADTKMRTRPATPRVEEAPAVGSVKDRLDRWLQSIDDQDPYRTLGVGPLESDQRIRERYRELARRHHPDLGGSEEAMARLNSAFSQILAHRNRRASLAHSAR